jgi:hypothetical protein
LLTDAEVLAASLLSLLASPVVAAYLLDRADLAFTPGRLLPIALLSAAGVFLWLRRRGVRAHGGSRELAAYVSVVAGAFAWLMWLARPSFLPLGTGPDLTHHLLLVEFVERHWALVHEPRVEYLLGEMVQYTPGSHVLIALAGALVHSDGLHAAHGLISATVALKAGFVFLIALRLLPPGVARIPFALLSVVFLLAPRGYVLGAFTQDSFFAQVVAECLAVAMWWMLTAWDEAPWNGWMALFSLTGVALFLTWPVFVGALIVALAALTLLRGDMTPGRRLRQLALGVGPIGLIAVLYIVGRAGWMQIVRTGGFILRPSVHAYGWGFLVLSIAGILLVSTERKGRATALFVAAIGLEMLGLFVAARTRANDTPYMMFKMFYLLIYPQAVCAMLALAAATQTISRRFGALQAPIAQRGIAAVSIAIGVLALRPFAPLPRPAPAISEPLALAGSWARDHVPASCVEYLVGDALTGYWLHLAVLGNPRMSARTGDVATFDRTAAIIRWLTPGGYPYAIADLPSLPADVRSDLDVVADFGPAAVVKRRGASSCPQ